MTQTATACAELTGLLLAGGRSQRMGTDKAVIDFNGQTLLQHGEQRLAQQVAEVLISSNNADAIGALTDSPILADTEMGGELPAHSGPLAGILTALLWISTHKPGQPWLLSVSVDTPQFPPSLAEDLLSCAVNEQRLLVCAASGGKQHPTCALWHTQLIEPLQAYLLAGERRLMRFHEQSDGGLVDYPKHSQVPQDPFANLNTPADLAAARHNLDGHP